MIQQVRQWMPHPTRETSVCVALLMLAIVFNLYYLWPEVAVDVPKLNDGVLHIISTQTVANALEAHHDPTDRWVAPIVEGYPLFHHYQHLGYIAPAAVFILLREHVGLTTIFNWSTYLLLSFFPLSVFWAMRRFGFSPITAALGGLVAPLLSTDGLYGFDDLSYTWRGFGLYTQLWGMVLLPPALAQAYATLRTGRGYLWSVVLVAATLLCHLVLGYIGLLSLALFIFLKPESGEVFARARRLLVLLGLVALASSYFLVPFASDSAYLNRGVWELQTKYDAYGYEWTLHRLFDGDLFDFGRFPSLTILVGAGLAVCAWRWREERFRIPALLGVLWLLLYFGRPTWGVLLNLLPLSRDMQFHRLIAGVHLAGIMLIPIALAVPWHWALRQPSTRFVLAPLAVTALLLYPVYSERHDFLVQNGQFERSTQSAVAGERRDLDALTAKLHSLPPGRVYAGRAANWGHDYRVGSVPMYALLQSDGFDMLGFAYHSLSLNADVQLVFDDQRLDEYDLFGVRYAVAPTNQTMPAFAKPIGDFGRHRLYQIETTGYFDLVGSHSAYNGDRRGFYPAASAWLATGDNQAGEHPALYFEGVPGGVSARPLSEAPADLPKEPVPAAVERGRVSSEAAGDGVYEAVVRVDRDDTYVMVKETFHPGWHATVDGRPADTVMLMPSYIGIRVPIGAHSIRVEYHPPQSRHLLMVVGGLTLLVLAVFEWRGRLLIGDFRRALYRH